MQVSGLVDQKLSPSRSDVSLKSELLPQQSREPVGPGAHVPTFWCTHSTVCFPTQQLRPGLASRASGGGWAVPKLGSGARNQGQAHM